MHQILFGAPEAFVSRDDRLPPHKYRRAVLLLRANEFLPVLGSQEPDELRLQGGEGCLLPLRKRAMRRGKRCPHTKRRCGGNSLGKLNGAIELLVRRRDVLDKTEVAGFFGTPIFAAQHVTHGVGPAGFPDEPDRGTAAGERPGKDFALVEYGVARGDANVAGEKQLVSDA